MSKKGHSIPKEKIILSLFDLFGEFIIPFLFYEVNSLKKILYKSVPNLYFPVENCGKPCYNIKNGFRSSI